MRNYIIYLIMIMFVGGHVVSDIYHHYSDGVEISALNNDKTTGSSVKLVTIKLAQLIMASSSNNSSTNRGATDNSISQIHCVAHCGLAASEFTAYHPGPRLYLAPPNDISTIINTARDHFRPPIA